LLNSGSRPNDVWYGREGTWPGGRRSRARRPGGPILRLAGEAPQIPGESRCPERRSDTMPTEAAVTTAIQETPSGGRYFPVPLDSIDNCVLEMDLYLKTGARDTIVLYRGVGVPFSEEHRERLAEQRITFLYVPMHQHKAYRRMLTQRLDKVFHDPQLKREERTRIVRSSCERMVEDAMLFPDPGMAVAGVTDISERFSAWMAEDTAEFSYLLDMSAHDFYTVTHMVNVGVGCGLLARELRPDEPELHQQFLLGGLLHDLGKRGVPESVLNKEGRLTPEEWLLIKAHPLKGYKMLAAVKSVPEAVMEMARDHHEKLDGSGYPAGLRGEDIGLAARICAVIDVYDAISAQRPYRGPTPPRETLRIMSEAPGQHFDPVILQIWTDIVERLLEQDASRAVPENPEPSNLSLDGLVQDAPVDVVGIATDAPVRKEGADRRVFPRFECNVPLKARFIWQGKQYRNLKGNALTVRARDISRGGMLIEAGVALTLNDVLELELPGLKGTIQKRFVRVVRIRRSGEDRWEAGVRFIASRPAG